MYFQDPCFTLVRKRVSPQGNGVLAGEVPTLDYKKKQPSGREFRLQLAVAGSHKSTVHFKRTEASTKTYRQKSPQATRKGLLAHSDFLVLFVLARMTSPETRLLPHVF